MLISNHKAKTQINQSYNPNIWSNIILNIFHQSNRKIKVDEHKMKRKEEDHIQHLNSYSKSDHWEKCRNQMPLKLLGVCRSLRDQQYLFLNHSILSLYENDMKETRY